MSPQSLPQIPRFLVHKRSGNARVIIQGQELWLGPANLPAAREKYDHIVAEWLANGRRLPPDSPPCWQLTHCTLTCVRHNASNSCTFSLTV